MYKRILISGGLFCGAAVIIGAFAAHALKNTLSDYALDIVKTGAQYQMFHGIAIILCGLVLLQLKSNQITAKWLKIACSCFITGILLFSGSLYGLALTSATWLGPMTPIGGSLFGWASFIWAIISNKDLS